MASKGDGEEDSNVGRTTKPEEPRNEACLIRADQEAFTVSCQC